MPGFKAPQDRLSLIRGKAAGDFELKTVTVTVLKVLGPVRIALNLLCMCSLSGRAKPAWQHTCLQREALNISSPRSRPTAQKKRLKMLPLMDSAPVAQKPMETNSKMNVLEEDQVLRSEIIVKMAVLCKGTHGVQRGKMQWIHDQIWLMIFPLCFSL